MLFLYVSSTGRAGPVDAVRTRNNGRKKTANPQNRIPNGLSYVRNVHLYLSASGPFFWAVTVEWPSPQTKLTHSHVGVDKLNQIHG